MSKIVTNLRIDKDYWLQIKAMAGELGLSVNQYINYLIRDLSTKMELTSDSNDAPIWHLPQIHKKVKSAPMGRLSEEDKIIYGL